VRAAIAHEFVPLERIQMQVTKSFRRVFLAAILLSFSLSGNSDAASIPPFFIDSVVALGAMQPVLDENGNPVNPARFEWVTEGTGFFYGYLVSNDPDPKKRKYELYLVTAKHVVKGHLKANPGNMIARINPKTSSSEVKEFGISNQPSQGEVTWLYHENQDIDLAIVQVNVDLLRQNDIEPTLFFANDMHVANIDKITSLEISEGDGVFVLGFPMGLTGVQRNYVIVREGVIARLSEMKDRVTKTFMIDSFVFPGNSGGPVVLKAEPFSIEGTKNQPAAYLIGVVIGYIPYTDFAIGNQTKRPRIRFEENSGLAEILPTDYTDEAIKSWRSSRNVMIPPPALQLPLMLQYKYNWE
jgi:S1-C subfamily serine protease